MAASGLKMTSSGWAWIASDTVVGAEFKEVEGGAREEEAMRALSGWLYVAIAPGEVPSDFFGRVNEYNRAHFNTSATEFYYRGVYAAAMVNAVLLFAHAATRVLDDGGNVDDGALMFRAMTSLSFEGIQQQPFRLNKNGDAIESYDAMNYVYENGAMHSIEIGHFADGRYLRTIAEVRWPGGQGHVPRAFVPTCGPGQIWRMPSNSTYVKDGVCEACMPGWYQPIWNETATACMECPPGAVTAMPMQTTCTTCPEGTQDRSGLEFAHHCSCTNHQPSIDHARTTNHASNHASAIHPPCVHHRALFQGPTSPSQGRHSARHAVLAPSKTSSAPLIARPAALCRP